MSRKIQFACLFLLLGLLSTAAQSALAQSVDPLNFGNNFFVTGDYVVGGAYGLNAYVASGFTKGIISIPDLNPGIQPGPSSTCVVFGFPAKNCVPAGAQIVGALLYWQTVEQSSIMPGGPGSGQNGFFRPLFDGGPRTGYPITGTSLPSQTTVSFNFDNCTCIVRAYRADVRAYLRQDANGDVLANGQYEVTLASSYEGAPHTLGATLVLIYRVLSPNFPLNSIVIYEGAFTPGNPSFTMTQKVQGFYDAAESPVSRLTHIVGGGNFEKYQTVKLGTNTTPLTALPSLYGSGHPAFPGWYGHWDNPTWTFSKPLVNPVKDDDASATTQVVQSKSDDDEGGRLFWGAVIVSTTVQNSDGDGLLDAWKKASPPGYCDASVNEGVCNPGDPSWVDLTGAAPGTPGNPHPDVFVQLDYMCSSVTGTSVTSPGSCDTTNNNYSFDPRLTVDPVDGKNPVQKVVDSFKNHGVNLHVIPTHAILDQQQPLCTDVPGFLCPFPNQPGVVGWPGGFVFYENQLVDTNSGNLCPSSPGPGMNCVPVFQHGKKDSYHHALFAHALGLPNWTVQSGTLTSVVQSGTTVAFTTSTPHGLTSDTICANDNNGLGRVTVAYAITNLNMNGTFCVTVTGQTTFTIQVANSTSATYTRFTDPNLAVASGQAGTISGYSDIGGAQSLITLGNWGPDGQTWQVKAGTFMHELGHSIGLTHGGFYYDTPGSYVPTVEAQCKSNHQSVMNYLFQVDLLDNGGPNNVPDYSGQALDTLYESNTILSNPFTTLVPTYLSTSWYVPTVVGTPATLHCDGTLITDGAKMNRVTLPTGSLSWSAGQDINFDGNLDANTSESLRGYNDWSPTAKTTGIDLRQISATGTLSASGTGGRLGGGGGTGGKLGGGGGLGGLLDGGGGTPGKLGGGGGTGGKLGGGGGTGGKLGGGGGQGEITRTIANSVTRPPRNLMASEEVSARFIDLSWTAPTFGQIGAYRIYRSSDGGTTFTLRSTVPGTQLTYQDTVTCNPTGYMYYVTAVLAGTFAEFPPGPTEGQESVASNIAPSSGPKLTGCYTNAPPSVTLTNLSFPATNPATNANFVQGDTVPITWSLQDDDTAAFVPRTAANTLVAIGPILHDGACPTLARPPVFLNHTGPYPFPVSTLSSSGSGITLNNSQFSFIWNTTNFNAGCWFFELDLDSGQFEQSTTALTLDIFVSDATPHVTTTTLPDATVGVPYSNTVFESGGTANGTTPFSWTIVPNSVTSNGSPVAGIPGISFQPNAIGVTNGTLSGTATTAGTYTFTAQVMDSVGNVGMQTLMLRVLIYVSDSPPFTTTTTLPNGVVGIPYSNMLFEAGGIAPFNWTVVSGSLPPGTALDPASGTLSGTPTTAGTYMFTAKVTDSMGNFGTRTLTVTVVTPGGLVYVANCTGTCSLVDTGSVSAYVIDAATGGLTPVANSPFAAGVSPFWVTDPAGRFVYVANSGDNTVSAYSIDPTTGALTAVSGSPFSTGGGPSSVAVDPTGRFAYVANRSDSTISAFTINLSTGALTAVAGSPFAAVTGSQDFTVTVDASGQFAYVTNLGNSNSISAYTIDQTTGALTAVTGSPFSAGMSPFVMAVDPAAPFAYAANNADSTISAYTIDTTTGALSSIGSPFAMGAGTSPRSVTVDPLGQFLYTANQNGSVSAFSINVTTGALSAVGSPLAAGSQPDSVAVDATSKFAYVANAGSNNVSAYTINGTTGALTAVSGSPFNAGAFPASVAATPYACAAALPAGVVPFTTIFSIATDTAGDTFVVGGLVGGTTQVLTTSVPLPTVSNERFCNPVTLETNYTVPVYVPTAAERTGDFSAYPGLILTDSTGTPFPTSNIIPPGKLGSVFAWRIAPHSPNLTRLSCSLESSLKSIEGHAMPPSPTSTATKIQFANDTAGPVNVYWLNYQGQRVFYRGGPYLPLAAGSAYTQGTFITHPWVITDVANNKCLGIWLPTESLGTAVITGSVQPPFPPSAPTGLNAALQPSVLGTSAGVILNWTASTGAMSYNVYRATAQQGPYTKLTSVLAPTTTYTDTSVTGGTTYYYFVTAVDASSNEGAYSSLVPFTVPVPPLAPTNLSATATATPSVVLTWTASLSNNVASYNVYQATAPTGPFTKLTSVPSSTTNFTDTTVVSGNGTTYYYMTTAVDGSGNESVYSNPASALIP